MKVTKWQYVVSTRSILTYIALVLISFSISLGWASVSTYQFSSSLSLYAEISGGTVLGSNTNDNESFNAIPLGFTFVYNGVGYNEISVQTNGFLAMGNTVVTSNVPISAATGTNNIVAALSRDIKSRDNGELSYLLTGAAPNRIFTVQWEHYRRIPTTTANDDFSFQIQLQENGNKVVFTYGSFYAITSATAASIQVGLRGNSNTDFSNRTTTSDWNATTAGTTNNSSCTLSNAIFPTNGLTFSWRQNLDLLNPAINPSPAFTAVNISIDTNLTWQNGGGTPTGYKLYLGTNNPPSNISNGIDLGLVTTYDPALDLQQNTTYYWKITPYDAQGDLAGCPIWSFTTINPPLPAAIVSPVDGATGLEINTTLNWTAGLGYPDGYKVYFGTDNPPTNIVNGTIQTVATFDPTPDLEYNNTYYWQIVPFTSIGDATNCPVWSFTTRDQAMPAISPSPDDNATNVSIQSTLSWQSGGGNPTGYRFYLGTDNPPTNMMNGTSQTYTTYDPELLYNTTYYWKIVPYNQYGNAIGSPIWTFTTINPVQISPTSLDFGTVQIGQSSDYQQIDITNASDTDNLIVQEITLAGINPTEFEFTNTSSLPLNLLPNQTSVFQVRYCPLYGGEAQAIINFTVNNTLFAVSLSGSSLVFTEINANLSSAIKPTWGDYDNDGDLDILSIESIYRHNGDGSFTYITTDMVMVNVYNSTSAWGDYDNDGDLDVLVSGSLAESWTSPIFKLYRNDGGNTFTEIITSIQGVYNGSAAWGDYDNDGDLDILLSGEVSNSINYTRIYRNNADNTFTEIDAGLPGVSYSCVTWGDFDNDSDLDICLGGSFIEYGGVTANIYRNDGCNIFTNIQVGLAGGDMAWGDYDNDGDLDLLTTQGDVTRIYRNDGDGSFCNINANIFGFGVYNGNVAWGDYDNDGDLDVLIMGQYGSSDVYLRVYRNNGDSSFSNINAGLTGVRYGSAAWGDYDNDGDLDIIRDGLLYRNNINNHNTPPSGPTLIYEFSGGLKIGSFNVEDDTTPSEALHYNYSIGSSTEGIDIVSPMSNSSGFRKLCAYGNSYTNNYTLEFTPNTSIDLYAASQAIDNSFSGSIFSNELHILTTTPALQITYPNGGEILVSGTTSYIRWADNSVRSLNVKLTPNNGVSWINISALPVPSSPGVYYYTVPSLNSTQCQIKILWARDETYYDLSDAMFTIRNTSSQPLMDITYPSAGINTIPGRSMAITWTALNLTTVTLDYTVDNGIHWNNIIENIPSSLSEYYWDVPDSVTTQARIRIRKADAATYHDVSDAFTICSLIITSPNGGEVIQTAYSNQSTCNITWNASYINVVSLYYNIGLVDDWQLITTTQSSFGHYLWTLPALESNFVKIKVQHSTTTDIYDVSDNYFSLQIPVWFTNVNGGGFLNNYSSPTLRWRIQNYNPSTNVFVEFSPDQSTWTRLNTTAIPLGSLQYATWLDVGSASQIWFRMVQGNNNKILARSANPITITSKYLAIISPNGGESWTMNSNHNIQWDVDGCTTFNIDYTADDGLTWSSIATDVPSTLLSYPWIVPDTPSTQCRIRFIDTTYSYMNLESDQNFTIAPFAVISPSGSFTADVTVGEMPLTVQFTENINPGSGILVQRLWNFGDGATSNQANPTHIYTTAGTYTVSLYLQNSFDAEATITMTDYITVLPNQPQIALSENVANFGTVYLGTSSNHTVYVRNIGTAPLIISNMGWLFSNLAFTVYGFVPNTSISAGDSLSLDISFAPTVSGSVSDSLIVYNNSINNPMAKLKVMGLGQYVPPQTPEDVQISIVENDAIISWAPVTETIFNTPIVPDYYFIYYNGSADTNGLYYFHGLTPTTTYTHHYVGLASSNMFYRVVAIKLYRDSRNNNSHGFDFDDYLKDKLHTGMTEREVQAVLEGL